MNFSEEFILLLNARYPILYIYSFEEDRLEYSIRSSLHKLPERAIYTWDFVEGYTNNPNIKGFASKNPLQALDLIEKVTAETAAIFILKDFNKFLSDISVARKIKNLGRILKTQPKTLIITATEVNVPSELRDLITITEFKLPTLKEIKSELKRLFTSLDQTLDLEFIEVLALSCQGLSIERIRRALSKSIAKYSKINKETINLILTEKRQIISQTEILEFESSQIYLNDIGGLKNLKEWLLRRKGAFSEKAENYGLPSPKGLLIGGIQGTGKSVTVKAIANDWKLPLLRLDVGRLFAGIVGESESRVRQMIDIAEALAPCILWIDEIDKAFSTQNTSNDSGTTSRVFGTFITWLSEKTSPVFVVATANNFKTLPLEIIRKGRFDEIFFVNLPDSDERQQIFEVLLKRIRPEKLGDFNTILLSQKSEGFSGAEIEQGIIEGMFIAFNEKRDFIDEDIIIGLKQIIPISQVDIKQIQELQEWALSGKVRLAS
jgi:SpoVK/Ycf46/Vps4 family AAA+-type ATPase